MVKSPVSNDHVLKHHFNAHSQEDWSLFESLTAKGEWHLGAKDYFVDYFIKQPNRWAAVTEEGAQRLISNSLYAGTKGLTDLPEATAFAAEEALALSFVWSFGSPLFEIADQLSKKGAIQMDQKPCHWYQFKEDKYTYDYFITKSDHLFYKVTISNEEGLVVASTTMAQYRKFGPYHMPSQVTVKTARLDYLMVFTDYVIGDYVSDREFSF